MPKAPSKTHPSAPLLVGIAGGTGSGKTTLARRIVEGIGENRTAVLPHDAYYRDRSGLPPAERADVDYDHPSAFETDLLLDHLERLRHGKPVPKLSYDYTSHCRQETDEVIHPAELILVEGILVLWDERLRRVFDLSIFVDADPDVRVIRRILRDVRERGRELESVVRQYLDTVRPAHREFVEPSRRYADITVSGERLDEAMERIIPEIRDLLRRKDGTVPGRPSGPLYLCRETRRSPHLVLEEETMSSMRVLRQRLLAELEGLPENRAQEVLDFVRHLRTREKKREVSAPARELDPEQDPILQFIGGVSCGSLARDIDKTLYGGMS